MSKLLLLALTLTSCVTPANWKPKDHQDQMLLCAASCEESGAVMRSYSPLTGKCVCTRRNSK